MKRSEYYYLKKVEREYEDAYDFYKKNKHLWRDESNKYQNYKLEWGDDYDGYDDSDDNIGYPHRFTDKVDDYEFNNYDECMEAYYDEQESKWDLYKEILEFNGDDDDEYF